MAPVGVYGPRFYGSDLDVGVTTVVDGVNVFKQNQGDPNLRDNLGNAVPASTVTADAPPDGTDPPSS